MHAVQCHVQGPLDEDRLNFGKHRTKHIRLVEVAYLQWILTNFPESSAWRNAAANALRQQREAEQEVPTLLADLKACSTRRDLDWGRKIHSRAVECGSDSNVKVAVGLIQMYSKCSSMVDARRVFDSTQKPDVIAWTALLLGYAENGEGSLALELFSTMKSHGCMPNSVTYVAALKACMGSEQALDIGRSIHSEVGCHLNLYVQNALIDMYAKAGSMVDAHRVFDNIQDPDVVSWTALLLGYAENGKGHITLELFSKMKTLQCEPSYITYVAVLKACTSLAMAGSSSKKARALETGRVIHLEVGHHLNRYVQSTLIDMYARCGSLADARCVFDNIQNPHVVSWNVLLLGYAENGKEHAALELFSSMKARSCKPDSVTYIAALKACTSLALNGTSSVKEDCLGRGREIHAQIGCHLNHLLQNTLLDMYSRCGSMAEARRVFDSIHKPDVVSWTTLLLGYAENGEGLATLELFTKMKARGCVPDSVTYVAALKACISLAVKENGIPKLDCLERGRRIHSEIGCHLNYYVQNTLVAMYAKCGSMVDARRVFDSIRKPDVISWNVLLLGYTENGEGVNTLDMFSRMKASGCTANSITYVAAFKACTSLAVNGTMSQKRDYLERGREIHLSIDCHLEDCAQNTLMDFYSKCGSMDEARRVFDKMLKTDVVSWNILLLGYADNGNFHESLELFSRMKAHCTPDSVTYIGALKACTALAVNGETSARRDCLERGREIHAEIGCHLNNHVQNTLIDMYSKCGSSLDARSVFDEIQKPDVVSWTTLVKGYAENGEALAALDSFSSMKARGCAPDALTYVATVKACGLLGALPLGRRVHAEISELNPHILTCLVDFYAKCGSMAEARSVFDLHPKIRDIATWNALFAGYGSSDGASVFGLFDAMQDEGVRPDAVTFVCLLLCCSHAGLVDKAREYFDAMQQLYRVTPAVIHYNSMVDLLGRANQLNEAIALLRKMPCSPDKITWTVLLSSCRKWKNAEIGRLAFWSMVHIDKQDASAYVLMAELSDGRGLWDEEERVLEMRMRRSPASSASFPRRAAIVYE